MLDLTSASQSVLNVVETAIITFLVLVVIIPLIRQISYSVSLSTIRKSARKKKKYK